MTGVPMSRQMGRPMRLSGDRKHGVILRQAASGSIPITKTAPEANRRLQRREQSFAAMYIQ
jgi:hypothetical protein